MRERRILSSRPKLVLFHLLALLPAVAVTATLRPVVDDPALAYYLGFGLVGSVSWSLLWLSLQQHSLKAFRQPGAFEELLSAPLSPSELADGLAAHSLGRALRSAAFLLVPLAIGLACLTPDSRGIGLGILLRVLFILLLGVPLASYLSLCLVTWSHGSRRDFGHLALLVVMAPMASLLGLLLHLDHPLDLASVRIVLVSAVLLGGTFVARRLALVGLSRGSELTRRWRLWWDSLVRSARGGASSWRRFSSNPVALREFDRESAAAPGGPLSMAIWVYGPFLMVQAALLWVLQPSDPLEVHLLYLSLLGVIVFSTGLRACSRAQAVVGQDMDSACWQALRQTRLGSGELVDGVALAAWLPRTAEAALLVLGTLPVAVLLGVSPVVALPAALLTLLAPLCLAYTGVASALEGSLGQMALVTHLCTWFSLISVYSAAVLALRTWTAFETGVPSGVLDVACLGLWLIVVSVPYVLDTRLRALRRLRQVEAGGPW